MERHKPLLPRKKRNMSTPQKRPQTVLNFCCDRVALNLRGWFLNEAGYRVVNSSNGLEAIKLSTGEAVDVAVLDLEHNHSEVAMIAKEIKRLCPQVLTIMLTERTVPVDGVRDLADVLVRKETGARTLVKSLERLLALT